MTAAFHSTDANSQQLVDMRGRENSLDQLALNPCDAPPQRALSHSCASHRVGIVVSWCCNHYVRWKALTKVAGRFA